MDKFEVAVVGGGLAGQIAALALGRAGRRVVLIAPTAAGEDHRTTALMDQSIAFMRRLGVWERMEDNAAALSTMQIIDGTSRLLRAPPVAFRASEVGLDAFGYNFPNAAMLPVLMEALIAEPNATHIGEAVTSLRAEAHGVTISLANDRQIEAEFVIGADGRRSIVRESAGIDVRTWSYPQTALVLNFRHERPHRNTSTEFHTESGPFTQVPLPGDRSSLVWVLKPADAEAMRDMPIDELSRRVESRMQSLLGKVEVEPGVQAWPLSGMMAKSFGKGRVALGGAVRHVFPPIAVQGLNLSLRDIMALLDILAPTSGAPVAADAGERYDRKRRADVMSRTASVDILNRSLLSDFLPMQVLRTAGLHVLAGLSPLRGLVMREGVEPGRGFRSIPSAVREQFRRKQA